MTVSTARETARIRGGDRTVVLHEDGQAIIGRDAQCTLAFPDEARLSRRAARVQALDTGVMISNLSRTHGLVVDAEGALSRLPPAAPQGPRGSYVLTHGTAVITGPSWDRSPFHVTVVVPQAPSSSTSTPSGVATGTATEEPLQLRTRTKEFLTTMLLCRGRLLDATDLSAPPAVPQLTRQVLEATNSWHLLQAFDTDETTRNRLTGRVHEHLKALRAKLLRAGLAPRGSRLTPAMMVDLLVVSGVVTRAHLALLEDEDWLRHQEALWWDV
ncbi:FHA domain-containing protein [Actinomycetospora sp. TBRC 11914]|uniref:FHA domain-containing protein n=1 Tax=Actinomycetospora sp. TBRC 11914 TaxID=2729387 RepID=UPI00145C9728|nr:FHA domain-containing protein [Actinomycetospora sp. TBRC 11914]NMO90374.1 hypothetical protein [Actinomycetospora sp. TBRC 11914]